MKILLEQDTDESNGSEITSVLADAKVDAKATISEYEAEKVAALTGQAARFAAGSIFIVVPIVILYFCLSGFLVTGVTPAPLRNERAGKRKTDGLLQRPVREKQLKKALKSIHSIKKASIAERKRG